MDNEINEYFSTILADLVDSKRRESNPIATMESVAKDIGISKGALSQYISGKREPKISTLFKIATYFGVSPNTLLGYSAPEETNTLPLEIHAHTGLSMAATAALHQLKDDFAFMPTLNFLLEDCAEDSSYLMRDIVEYMVSDLWDDLAKDERYNTLPGTAPVRSTERNGTHSEVVRRECLLDIQDGFPYVREALHATVLCCDDKTKKAYVSELAMKNIHQKTVLKILYPPNVVTFLCSKPSITPDDIDTIEALVRDAVIQEHPELKEYEVLPATFCDFAEYDEYTAVPNDYVATIESKAVHRKQALDFIKEYVGRYGKI